MQVIMHLSHKNHTILYFSHITPYSLATVGFTQSEYSVDEDDGLITVVLILSNPLSTDINVLVRDTNGSATGIILDITIIVNNKIINRLF